MFKYIDKRPYEPYNYQVLSQLAKGNETFLQRMSILHTLNVHKGCVNSVVWDDTGEILLSGSDDQNLVISKPWSNDLPFKLSTAHRANIFSAKFIPYAANRQIISCSGDGMVIYTDLDKIPETHNCKFACHLGTAYDVITLASDPHSFFSCGEDGTVRWFDLRVKTSCEVQDCKEDILLDMRRAVTAIAVNPMVHFQLAVATQDSCIHVYDRRMLGTKAHDSYIIESNKAIMMKLRPEGMEGEAHRITSLKYNSTGREMLASYSSNYLYLFDTQNFKSSIAESTSEVGSDHDCGSYQGPTLKRLRLRGDWSDTGPQAVPESELGNHAEDVGQARPTLHSNLMQRMTDILSRMLHSPSPSSRRETRRNSSGAPLRGMSEGGAGEENLLEGALSVVSDGGNVSAGPDGNVSVGPDGNVSAGPDGNVSAGPSDERETTSSAPPSIASPATGVPLFHEEHSVPTASETSPCTTAAEHDVPLIPTAVPSVSELFSEVDSCITEENQEVTPLEIVTQPADLPRSSVSTAVPPNVTDSLKRTYCQTTSPSDDDERENCEVSNNPICELPNNDSTISDTSLTTGTCDNVTETVPSTGTFGNLASTSDTGGVSVADEARSCDISKEINSSRNVSSCLSVKKSEIDARNAIDIDEAAAEGGLRDEQSDVEMSNVSRSSLSQSADRKSPKRRSPSLDEEQEELSETRPRSVANVRMTRAINRVVQKITSEKKSQSAFDPSIPFGSHSKQFRGHRNARTMIKEACFWGEKHVMSGSDCGRVFVWEKSSGRIVMLWVADRHVVNCVQPHPSLPVLATSGIDYDVKLWAPTLDEPNFDEESACKIAKINERLLDETRDTVTVPATFMIRMLASLNQLRQDRLRNRQNNNEEEDCD